MPRLAALALVGMVSAWAGASAIHEDFESYSLGSLNGLSGPGGLTWSATNAGDLAAATVARPGFESEQSARWEVEDVGTVSQGDDMFAAFEATGPRITVQAMTYAYLSQDPQYTGHRSASFTVLSDMLQAIGVGLVWHASGRVADTQGHLSNIQFTNAIWVPIRVDLDYSTGNYAVWYGGVRVTTGTLLAREASAATILNISLETMPLDQTPSPNDSLLIDDISITPEPAAPACLLAGLAFFRRR